MARWLILSNVLTTALLCIAPASATASKDDVLPMQLRLAYAGDTGMMVSWNTYSQLLRPAVRYGRKPNLLDRVATSDVSVTYQTSTTYNNHVPLHGLAPDTTYYYLPQFSNITEPYSFKTSRSAGDQSPYSVAVAIDLGLMGPDGLTTRVGKGAGNPLKSGDNNTLQSLQAQGANTDFLWHPGDIAYADYWLKEEIQGFLPNTTIANGSKVYESLLKQYYDEMSVITAKKPYMVGPGNHEANCDNGGTTDKVHNISYTVSICMPGQTNFTGYRNHFRMPSAQSGGVGNFWYSFDNGMVHYIQFDTETDLGHGFVGPDEVGGSEEEDSGAFSNIRDAQLNWLEKDLSSVNRSKTPWVIAAGHRPWYISKQNVSSSVCEDCRKAFEPLLIKYGVDLVLSGHAHVYERNAPISVFNVDPNGLNNPSAPWYITNGAAGHYDGLDPLLHPLQPYSRAAQDTAYGWSRLTFHNCTHLTHELISSSNGTVLDTATLFKKRKCGE
ncbi:Metallo-dependent phosphatase-like protein [Penicillium hispanicum]|uniref:Metallo-dependent phosphatase-like protein n=1 Tax=Penicillium hispanicum TaxID=1080232 RepID=UPI00254204B1|nr:Metallo-dependent phosphatase-like protein [Penicillium hispanicum]KAJ5584663.1 Metallo-dependent phosphatase-like protein [Penicillium hispanicum]